MMPTTLNLSAKNSTDAVCPLSAAKCMAVLSSLSLIVGFALAVNKFLKFNIA